jgi:predicted RNase H-like nuclease (RuvC/YqgF family)
MLISTYEEAEEFIFEFKHLIQDDQILKVLDCLQNKIVELESEEDSKIESLEKENEELQETIDEQQKEIKKLEAKIAEAWWKK